MFDSKYVLRGIRRATKGEISEAMRYGLTEVQASVIAGLTGQEALTRLCAPAAAPAPTPKVHRKAPVAKTKKIVTPASRRKAA